MNEEDVKELIDEYKRNNGHIVSSKFIESDGEMIKAEYFPIVHKLDLERWK